ncbi:hypothetical protein D9613_010951 [Agrocybe pediades]|uniref:Uncharacterized protein n=1 Tax=Agrocybe pediades TaxID=84607 RepID=A0A8H4QKV3_9AGAR|nr:hypothetical protein D9613_010951 [Agrocybe pediades]
MVNIVVELLLRPLTNTHIPLPSHTEQAPYLPPCLNSPAAVLSYHHHNDISSHHHMTQQPPSHMPSFQLPQLSPFANITITTMLATAATTLPNIGSLCHVTQQPMPTHQQIRARWCWKD